LGTALEKIARKAFGEVLVHPDDSKGGSLPQLGARAPWKLHPPPPSLECPPDNTFQFGWRGKGQKQKKLLLEKTGDKQR
jgi:hypothetical protein